MSSKASTTNPLTNTPFTQVAVAAHAPSTGAPRTVQQTRKRSLPTSWEQSANPVMDTMQVVPFLIPILVRSERDLTRLAEACLRTCGIRTASRCGISLGKRYRLTLRLVILIHLRGPFLRPPGLRRRVT